MKYSGVEWIGNIPDNWEIKPIRECLFERNEKNDQLQENTILSLSAKDGVSLFDGEKHSGNKPKEDLSGYKIVKENDIVANSMNILSGSVGLSKYNGVVSPVYYIYHIKNSNDCIGYFNYIFQSNEFQKNLRKLGKGILIRETEDGKLNTIRTKVPSYQLSIEKIPYPNENIQRRVVELLDKKTAEIDSLIEIENKQIEKLKEYKQAIITDAVTKGLDKNSPMKDSGVEWLGKIPKMWKLTYLKHVAKVKDGLVDPTEATYLNFPHIGPGNIEKFTGRLMEYKLVRDEGLISGKYLFDENDIIYGKINPQLGKVTYPGFKGLCSADSYALTANVNVIKIKYLLYWFLARPFIDRTILESMRMGMPKINREDLMKLEIALPSLEEQTKIIDTIEKENRIIDVLLSLKQQKIEKLKEYKKSLIYEYVTGKKVI